MLRVLLVFLIGALFGWGMAGSLVPAPNGKERLIKEMGKIQPGMSLRQVEAALGRKPAYLSKPGESVGPDARKRFPESYWQEHGLQTYYIHGIGPYLLFIAYDRSERVTFVSYRHA